MHNQQHGGNITTFAKEIGCRVEEVIDLSSNINFVKPKIEVDFNRLNISPYPNYERLTNAIAKLYEVENFQVELFNGATSAIYALFRALELEEVTLYAPLYLEYERAAKIFGYRIEQINRFNGLEKEVKANSLVVFVNPSTPDGQFYNLKRVMNKWMQKGCTIIIDESFLDFTPYYSLAPYIKNYNKLYILKSMTKFYSAAGIRIGAIISHRENIEKLKAKEPIWKISEFDSCYLQEALKDNTFTQRSREINQKNRQQLTKILQKSPTICSIYPSSSNFVMIKLQGVDAYQFQEQLTPFKIMVRNCNNFKYLDSHYVRVAVKEENSLRVLEKALVKKE